MLCYVILLCCIHESNAWGMPAGVGWEGGGLVGSFLCNCYCIWFYHATVLQLLGPKPYSFPFDLAIAVTYTYSNSHEQRLSPPRSNQYK